MKSGSILSLSLAAAMLSVASFASAACAQVAPSEISPVPYGAQAALAPAALQGVESYTIYYGAPSAAVIEKLSAYQMVVVEPRLWSKAQLQKLMNKGVKVLGYLSVLEQYKDSQLLRDAAASDYLLVNGQRDYRSEWNSWSMNINSESYRQLLKRDYREQIVQKGLSGVFLDTVGNVDDEIWPAAINNRQRDGVVSFMQELRAQFPNKAIMQNWGLVSLKDRTAGLIDGILWEDFNPNVVKRDQWSQNRMRELDALQAQGLMVFIIKAGASAQKFRSAYDQYFASKGYVGQLIPRSYDQI